MGALGTCQASVHRYGPCSSSIPGVQQSAAPAPNHVGNLLLGNRRGTCSRTCAGLGLARQPHAHALTRHHQVMPHLPRMKSIAHARTACAKTQPSFCTVSCCCSNMMLLAFCSRSCAGHVCSLLPLPPAPLPGQGPPSGSQRGRRCHQLHAGQQPGPTHTSQQQPAGKSGSVLLSPNAEQGEVVSPGSGMRCLYAVGQTCAGAPPANLWRW